MTQLFARTHFWWASLAALLGCSPGVPQAVPPPMPAARPVANKEARDPDRSWVAGFQMVTIDRRVPLPPGAEEGPEFAALPDEQRSETTFRLELGRDYLVWESPSDQSYLDFPRRAWRGANHEAKVYQEGSLLAAVSFRVSEVYNRRALKKAFGGLPSLAAHTREAFAVESELGIQPPPAEGQPRPEVKVEIEKAAGGLIFRHGGRAWVEFEPSETQFAPETRKAWRMFLAHECWVHPAIRRELERQAFLPRRLTYRVYRGPRDYEVTLSLTNPWHAAEPGSFAVPAGYTLRQTEVPRLAACLDALARSVPMSAAEAYDQAERAIREAARHGRKIDAFFAAMEFSDQTGDDRRSKRLAPLVREVIEGDELLGRLVLHSAVQTEEGLTAAIREAQAIDRSRLAKAHMIDLHLAHLYQRLGQFDQAEDALLAALEVNPRLVGAWCGLGIVYGQSFRHADSWECIAAARRIAPRHQQLGDFNLLEAKLLRDFPDYF